MKEIVLASNGWFRLEDDHIEWLKQHGVPDATASTYENDRSNPLLIECVKAARIPAAEVVETALALQHNAEGYVNLLNTEREMSSRYHSSSYRMTEKAKRIFASVGTKEAIQMILNGKFGELAEEDIRRAVGNAWRYLSLQGILHECVEMEVSPDNFNEIVQTICLPSKWDKETSARTKEWYKEFSSFWKKNAEEFRIGAEANNAFWEFCEEQGLYVHNGEFLVQRSLHVEQYDDALFDVHIERRCGHGDYYGDEDYEELVGTPFITKDAICDYVANGDTDGLIAHLEALRSGIRIKDA